MSPNTVQRAETGGTVRPASVRRITDALGITRSEDPPRGPDHDGTLSPTVLDASRIVLDLPEGVLAGLAPEDVAELKALALAAFLRGRRELR